ncbi:hypothetical protein WDU94_006502 [Cyamophila willieti]
MERNSLATRGTVPVATLLHRGTRNIARKRARTSRKHRARVRQPRSRVTHRIQATVAPRVATSKK